MSLTVWALLAFPATSGKYTAALIGPGQLAHTFSSMLKRDMSKDNTSVAGSRSLCSLSTVYWCIKAGALPLSDITSASSKGLASRVLSVSDSKQSKLLAPDTNAFGPCYLGFGDES